MADTPTIQANQIADAIVAVPGSTAQLFDYVEVGPENLTATSWANMPGTYSFDYYIPVTGTYLVELSGSCRITSGTGSVLWGILLNDTTRYASGNWRITGPTATTTHRRFTATIEIPLEAGSNNFKLQYYVSGLSQAQVDAGNHFIPRAWLISGSGAGGVLVEERQMDQNHDITTVGSWVAVQDSVGDVSLSITTTANDWVEVAGKVQWYVSAVSQVRFGLGVDGSDPVAALSMAEFSGQSPFNNETYAPYWKFQPGAGSHTVRLMAYLDSAATFTVRGGSTPAKTILWSSIYRGGQVPVKNEGVSKTDTPAGQDYGQAFAVTVVNGEAVIKGRNAWRYFTATDLPTGAAAPEAVWAFDGSGTELNDLTANGHNLTVAGGTSRHTAAEGLVGLSSNNSFVLSAASPAGLRTLGAITAEFLVQLIPGSLSVLLFASTSGSGAPADNTNYEFEVLADHRLQAQHEYGNPTPSTETTTFDATPILGPVHYLVFTRSSDGLTHKAYVDGQLIDTQVSSNAPTDGGSVSVYLLGNTVPTNYFTGAMFSARVTKAEWTAAQVLEAYQWARRLG